MSATAPQTFDSWVFDVSALKVLINESEELKYRLSGRCLAEVLVAAPVSGIQSYLRSYEILLAQSQHTYFSPLGGKSAPLRNMKLNNYISEKSLLEDNTFTILQLKKTAVEEGVLSTWMAWTWLSTTWLCSGLVMAVAIKIEKITWIGISNFATLILWSIILRATEYVFVRSSVPSRVAQPSLHDAAFILGRNNAGVVIEGSREHVKHWTSSGLIYRPRSICGLRSRFWQRTTRAGTLAVMLFVFATIPNGSTMDQLAFVLLNILGQFNTAVGLWINANSCNQYFDALPGQTSSAESRTHLYASILKRFRHLEDVSWIESSNVLPNTAVWKEWAVRIVEGDETDPKDLYMNLVEKHRKCQLDEK